MNEKKSPVSIKAYNLPGGKVLKENGAVSGFLMHIMVSVLPTPVHSWWAMRGSQGFQAQHR